MELRRGKGIVVQFKSGLQTSVYNHLEFRTKYKPFAQAYLTTSLYINKWKIILLKWSLGTDVSRTVLAREGDDTQLKYFGSTSCYVKLKLTLVIR